MKRASIVVTGLGAALLVGCQDNKNSGAPADTMPAASAAQAAAAKPAAAKSDAIQIFEYRDGDKTYVFGSADSLARFIQTKQPPETETLYHNSQPVLVETTGGKQSDLF